MFYNNAQKVIYTRNAYKEKKWSENIQQCPTTHSNMAIYIKSNKLLIAGPYTLLLTCLACLSGCRTFHLSHMHCSPQRT